MNHRYWPLLAAFVALGVTAADGNLDVTRSKLIATFRQEGVPVDAPFRVFSGTISYDPARPAAASAALDVDTASFDLGDESYSAEVRKPAWFDSTAFPRATFRSTAVKANGATQFNATGVLTLKGRVTTVTVPVTVQQVGKDTVYSGTLTISRAAYAIGDPAWKDVLDDKVAVSFSLVTKGH